MGCGKGCRKVCKRGCRRRKEVIGMPRRTRAELEVENSDLHGRLQAIRDEIADLFDDEEDEDEEQDEDE